MKDAIRIGDAWVDREEISAVLPQNGTLLVFLRGTDRPMIIHDTFSREELRALVRAPEDE